MSSEDSPKFVDALKVISCRFGLYKKKTNSIQTVKIEDFKDVNKIPCARNALLYGIGNDKRKVV